MRHPYVGLPNRQFWKNEPGIQNGGALDPVSPPPFVLSKTDRIVTAGSCFAQHVARFIEQSGYNFYVSERAHPVIPEQVAIAHNYGLFTARYGNIYTARQLRQLLERAFGSFVPQETAWVDRNGSGVVDPFRPQIQPGGFASEAELLFDRAQHFACVRDAIANMDVFVFTLGLTEAWEDIRDGAIFPLAPGVAGGIYDPSKFRFRNFDEVESYEDLRYSIEFIRAVNAKARVILTVSPVPLNATYEDRHVLLSTTWSKAVLRIVAEKAVRNFQNCVYFPSLEIITSPHVRGRYFADDCREVTSEGVDHVMRLFLKHFSGGEIELSSKSFKQGNSAASDSHIMEMRELIEVLCDEQAIDNS